MKLNVYSIYDVKAGVYQRPFYAGADGEATRAFSDLVTDGEHPVGKHPEDYSLFRLGVFDDNNGKFQPEAPECLMTALQILSKGEL